MQVDVEVTGTARLLKTLESITPRKRPKIWRDMLGAISKEIVRSAQDESFVLGGRISDRPPHPSRLTSRTGRGRKSIRTFRSTDKRAVTVGSNVIYMGVHEGGGPVEVPAHRVKKHKRTVAFGWIYPAFSVGPFERSGYIASYPARPWLAPAIAKTRKKGDKIMRDILKASVS